MVDKFIAKQLTKSEENSKSLLAFKEYLSTLGEKLGNGKSLVFIIDELDRCKPKFSLAILESIKHLFSVPHITFVLVMNRTQLEKAVRCEYGSGVDASKYLQKFVSVWATLPKSNDQINPNVKNYLRSCLKAMNFKYKTQAHQNTIDVFEELAVFYNLSLREVEKSLTNFAIIYNLTDEGNLNVEHLYVAIFLCIIKVIKPEVYSKLSIARIDYEQLAQLAELKMLKNRYWVDAEEHELRWLLKYNLSSEEVASELIKDRKDQGSRFNLSGQRTVINICMLMDTFQQR